MFILAASRILSSTLWGEYLVPDYPPEASCLSARGKGCGLSIKGEPCKRVFIQNQQSMEYETDYEHKCRDLYGPHEGRYRS